MAPRRFALLIAVLAVGIAPGAAQAHRIDTGTIVVGKGVNDATLGMTKGEVRDALGEPSYSISSLFDYQPLTGSDNILELTFGRKHRVKGFIVSFTGSAFKLADGNAIFKRGGIKRLFRHYGGRVHSHAAVLHESSAYYWIRSHLNGRTVVTTFHTFKLKRTSRVFTVDIDFQS